MIEAISTQSVRPLDFASAVERKPAAPGFQDALNSALNRVESTGRESVNQMERFLSGEGGDLHNVAIASQRASLQFETFLQMRNKVVQAYQEVMRMQL